MFVLQWSVILNYYFCFVICYLVSEHFEVFNIDSGFWYKLDLVSNFKGLKIDDLPDFFK